MSQSLPLPAPGAGPSGATDNRPLNAREYQLLQRLLSDPFSLPMGFKTWLVGYLETSDLSLPMSSIMGLPTVAASVQGGDSAWHNVGAAGEPAFQNSWTNYGGFTPCRFRKLSSGLVLVQGLVRSGTAGTPIFTLPAGYRPDSNLLTATVSGEPPTGSRTDFNSSGAVIPDSRNPASWTALSNSFYADQ